MRKGFVLLVAALLFCSMAGFAQHSQTVERMKIKATAETFIRQYAPGTRWAVSKVEKQDLSEGVSVYLVRLNPSGFVVVSPASEYPVLAFSFKNNFGDRMDERSFIFPLLHEIYSHKPTPVRTKETGAVKTWGPYVHTMWGQVNCYDQNSNLINVTNYYTPQHYAAGCVAISMSTLLHYYRWPLVGTGSYSYTDSRGSSTGTYSSTFSNIHFKWSEMLDRYRYKRSSTAQRKAAGELAFQVAISLSMNFEPTGSTSNVNRIPRAGKNYFRFDGVEKSPSSKSFWDMLDFNMAHRIPAIFAIKNDKGGGHSIVCDGLKIDENNVYYYHLNMGWWGSSNGWYRIRDSWDAGGYNAITDGIFYFLPIPQLLIPHVGEGQKKVSVVWHYPVNANAQAFELQQKIGSGSWKTLCDTITDTLYEVNVRRGVNQYFRVRAKVAGRWPYDDWSNSVKVTLDVTGIPDNFGQGNFVLAPNPASEKLNIKFGKFIPSKMMVFDIYGRQVLRVDDVPEGPGFYLNISTLPDGYYFLRLMDKAKHLKILKFIKD